MIIIGPVAVAKNNVIGGDNDLPWYLPEDLKHFKKITTGHTVLMGRKTYESIINRLKKPLPDRKSVVITHQTDYAVPEGVLVFHSIDDAIAALKNEDLYFIGGASIFRAGLEQADYMYMTHVHKEYPGDILFPAINWAEWDKTQEEPHEEYTFAEYKRK